MLHEFTNKYQRKMWKSMISRKKLNFSTWDVIKFKNEKVFYMPYNNYMKFEIKTQHCLNCGDELAIGFRKNEFISGPCKCSTDGKNYATLQKLSSIFPIDEAESILRKFADAKTRNLKNRKKYWLDLGYTNAEAKQKVIEVQTTRSAKSPASKKGATEYTCRRPEFWMKKGMNEKEAMKKVSEVQVTNGLEWYTNKYGAEIGQEKFNIRIKKWLKKMSKLNIGISAISIKLFESIDPDCVGHYGHVETTVRGKSKVYRVDYLDKKQKKIIEFDGDYWHANPKKYKSTDMVRKKSAAEIWEIDMRKTKDLERAGYMVMRVAEGEYATNPSSTITRCREFLNEN